MSLSGLLIWYKYVSQATAVVGDTFKCQVFTLQLSQLWFIHTSHKNQLKKVKDIQTQLVAHFRRNEVENSKYQSVNSIFVSPIHKSFIEYFSLFHNKHKLFSGKKIGYNSTSLWLNQLYTHSDFIFFFIFFFKTSRIYILATKKKIFVALQVESTFRSAVFFLYVLLTNFTYCNWKKATTYKHNCKYYSLKRTLTWLLYNVSRAALFKHSKYSKRRKSLKIFEVNNLINDLCWLSHVAHSI